MPLKVWPKNAPFAQNTVPSNLTAMSRVGGSRDAAILAHVALLNEAGETPAPK